MLRKIKYKCKNCGWEKSIPEQWADLKPKRCGNPKCNTSFILDKEKLDIQKPKKAEKPKPKSSPSKSSAPKKAEKKEEVKEPKDEKVVEESDSKSKRGSKTKQQSTKEESKDSK